MAQRIGGMLALLLVTSTPVLGQTKPPLELGFGITTVGNINLGDFGVKPKPLPDGRVSVPISPRFAIEGTAFGTTMTTGYGERRVVYYTVQIRQRFAPNPLSSGMRFVTYGLLGAASRWRMGPHESTQHSLPGATAIGAGFQQRLGTHLALRAEGQFLTFLWWPLGTRLTASVSVPIGAYPSL